MEQKQLDELDETPIEEYIEEEDEVETFKAKKKAMKKNKKSPWDDEHLPHSKEEKLQEDSNKATAENPQKQREEAHASSVSSHSSNLYHEPKEPINPWSDTKEEPKSSTGWIITTVLLMVLLIAAIVTGGFGLMNPQNTLTPTQAEQKAVSYVNSQLLEQGLQAIVVSSKDVGEHYQITMEVQGQLVDTYISKDGTLFFPQGFDTSKNIIPNSNVNQTSTTPVDTKPVVKPVETNPQTPKRTTELTMTAKRWIFNPSQLTVPQGDHIKLNINPQSLTFTFAIPELGIEKEITGPTVIEFDVPNPGSYPYLCKSCEDDQAVSMTGIIVVE